MELNENDHLFNKKKIIRFLNETRNLLFPGYFEKNNWLFQNYGKKKEKIIRRLFLKEISIDQQKADCFMRRLTHVKSMLEKDLEMTFQSDPACESSEEIILTYPGFFAILTYRIAHELYELKIPLIPRMISEYAHSKTGIDIHPGATIGEYFFIDHGTGIVIGETAIIGHHVKIYHGVTLGALSLKSGQALKGIKRHPTIGNYVTIYSGASVLGGNTMIGDYVTLGCNVFVMESIPEKSKVVVNISIE